MNDLISIIVPIYKVESYLSKCIDSLTCQTYKNIEIILIDDGSPDNSGIICDEYALKDKGLILNISFILSFILLLRLTEYNARDFSTLDRELPIATILLWFKLTP